MPYAVLSTDTQNTLKYHLVISSVSKRSTLCTRQDLREGNGKG